MSPAPNSPAVRPFRRGLAMAALVVALAFGSGAPRADEAEDVAAYCAETGACRPAPKGGALLLGAEDFIEIEAGGDLPYVWNGVAVILTGEKLWVAGKIGGDWFWPETGGTATVDGSALEIELREENGQAWLEIENRLDRAAKYHAVMVTPESDELLKTSSCPVIGEGSAYETWPHPIRYIWLFAFRLAPGEEPENWDCEY